MNEAEQLLNGLFVLTYDDAVRTLDAALRVAKVEGLRRGLEIVKTTLGYQLWHQVRVEVDAEIASLGERR